MTAMIAVLLLIACLVAPPVMAGQADESVTRAIDQVRARAAEGDVVAQLSLGALLYYGTADTAEAIRWIRKAAEQQHAPAELHLGQMYEFGFGVARDDIEALAWYRRAAEHGSASAQRVVGEFYRKGRAVPEDAAEAARWFQIAADGDDLRAQFHLGQMYFEGTGVVRDYATALVWFTIAAAQTPLDDNRRALIELGDIAAARLGPELVVEARRRAAQWKPRPHP